MTARELYKACERQFLKTDWTDPESIKAYNKLVKELKEQRKREEENKQERKG